MIHYPLLKKIIMMTILVLVVYLIGAMGYYIIEPEYNFLDSFYMSAITLTTVGYGEIHPLSNAGRIFTIVFIMSSIGVVVYGVGSIAAIIFEGQLKNTFREQKMEKKIAKLKNHIILCGYGRLGENASQELEIWQKPYVVIEKNEIVAEKLKERNVLCICGAAERDENLIKAGVERAYGLITALTNDADNLYVTLTARGLNRDLQIVSRAEYPDTEGKLAIAGANKVLSPTKIAGRRMASILINPEVINFLDVVIGSADLDLSMQEVVINESSKLVGVTIKDSKVPQELKIIGLKAPGEKLKVNPPATEMLTEGSVLIILGENQRIENLRNEIIGLT